MTNESRKIKRIPIKKLEQSQEHKEVFGYFKRKYKALRRKLGVEGFDEAYPLIVRKTGGKYGILCGMGRYEYMKELDRKNPPTGGKPHELPCVVVDPTPEDAIILILKDNFQTCRAITGFKDFQYFLLGMLLYKSRVPGYSKEYVKLQVVEELNIGETIFYYMESIFDPIVRRLEEEKQKHED